MDTIEAFKSEKWEITTAWEKDADRLRKAFVSKYPIDSIQNLSMEEFLLGKENSFCTRIRYEMQVLASMGNAFPSVFGIYYKNNREIKLSDTYKNLCDNNISVAFNSIKNDIVRLLKAVENDKFSFFDTCNLNSAFKCKLVVIYFPEKVFPVCTRSGLENYCRVLGMHYNGEENMLLTMRRLLEWKQNLGEIAFWSDYMYMGFADWLWRSEKTIKDCKIKKHSKDTWLAEAEKIEQSISDIGLTGDEKEVVVKQRINQGFFRKILLDRYPQCCLCGVKDERFLIAGHIKPWSVASPEERVDLDNGFIMCPNHDKAFDKGLISFDDDGHIMISGKIDPKSKLYLNLNDDMTIRLTEGNKKYLQYHKENIYDALDE